MRIIGCDFHSRYQQIAMLIEETGEVVERRLEHENGEARAFYASLPKPVRVGIEATGYTQWFERLLQELRHELWVGDAAEIRARAVRKQKYDQRDAQHILRLMTDQKNPFPRIWMPSLSERDLRQLLIHRVRLVQWRTRIQNQLHAVAMGQGLCRKKKLWTTRGRQELESLPLDPWASRRRRAAGTLRPVESTDRRAEPGGAARSAQERVCGASDDASGRGTDHFASLRADHGSGEPLRTWQEGGQLSGAESQRGFLGRPTVAREPSANKAARCCVGCWWKPGRRPRDGIRSPSDVSAGEVSPRQSDRQGGSGPQTGREVVLDAAQPE